MKPSTLKPWIPREPPPEILFTNVNLIDPKAGVVRTGCDLLIIEGKIAEPATPDSCRNALVIDLQGKFVCPGLIDCHVHLTAAAGGGTMRQTFDAHPDALAYRTAWTAKQMLLRGFTTARDTGGGHAALRSAIAEGLVAGPRLVVAGKALSQTGGHGDFRAAHEGDAHKCCGGDGPLLGRVCDGVPACLEAARDELRRGADFLKIMVGGGVASPSDPLEMLQFTAEEIQAIVGAAQNLGTYVTAHAYTAQAIRHAVENGVRGIEHANFIDTDTAEYCAEMGVIVTPTLVTYQALISPPNEDFLPEDGRKKAQVVIDSGVTALKTLTDAGVMVCFGTDLLANMHPQQHLEFEIRARALPAKEILRSATTYAAKLLRLEGKVGTLEVGAYADALILDQNPLEDISVLAHLDKHCSGILKEGRVVMSRLESTGLLVDNTYR